MDIRKPRDPEPFSKKLNRRFETLGFRGAFNTVVDRALVALRWQPEEMDGRGMIMHLSDTPSGIYGYIARLLRRTRPSVIVHTGDLADDIKLELYPGESERYRAAARRLLDIVRAPHRRVYMVLGNHDDRELLPPAPPDCQVYGGAVTLTLLGASFRISHYIQALREQPASYNLFGHTSTPHSHEDESKRVFLNGMEGIRLIDPRDGAIWQFDYPKGTNEARMLRTQRCR